MKERLGWCYKLAGERLWDLKTDRLVHGSIQGMGHPRIDHAWIVQKDGTVWEPVLDQVFDPQVFALAFHAEEHQSYSVQVAAEMMIETGTWGPW